MLEKIKELKLKNINSQLQQYKKIDEQIASLDSQIATLKMKTGANSGLIPYREFSWTQKHITQRKAYKNYVFGNKKAEEENAPLEKQISELVASKSKLSLESIKYKTIQEQLQEEFEKILQAKTLKELNFTLEEATQIIENEDKAQTKERNKQNIPYSFLVPTMDISDTSKANDIFRVGKLNLTGNSLIVCPKGEEEEIKKANPEIRFIEYGAKTVQECTPDILSTVETINKSIEMASLLNKEDKEKSKPQNPII